MLHRKNDFARNRHVPFNGVWLDVIIKRNLVRALSMIGKGAAKK